MHSTHLRSNPSWANLHIPREAFIIVGPKHKKLEQRITRALLSGIAYSREAHFLHQMSERLLRWGSDAVLSPRQMDRLSAIMARCEQQARQTTECPRTQHRPQESQPQLHSSESLSSEEAFSLEEAINLTSETATPSSNKASRHSPRPSPSSPSLPTLATPCSTNPLPAPPSQPVIIAHTPTPSLPPIGDRLQQEGAREADVSSVFQRALARADVIRKRRAWSDRRLRQSIIPNQD